VKITPNVFHLHLRDRQGRLRRAETAVIGRAQQIMRRIGPRLRGEARRLGGLDGLALADALVDIVTDGERIPESWPIEEMIELLAADAARTEPLLHDLCGLARSIGSVAQARLGTALNFRADAA
jgi:hypothetical protein